MNKKQKNILVLFLIGAGLLIAVLYSPIASPDLYSSDNYYITNLGVQFKDGVIKNAPSTNLTSGSNSFKSNSPAINSFSNINYFGGSNQYSNSSLETSRSMLSNTLKNKISSASTEMNGGGVNSFYASKASKNSSASSDIFMTNGIATMLSADLSHSNSRQNVMSDISPLGGGTNPGEDPLGAPIPVGDGWGLLFFFGACYAAYKKRLSIKGQFLLLSHHKK